MINNRVVDMRIWAVCLTAYCIACTGAVACMGPSFERGILFEHVPAAIDAPIVIEATIYGLTQVGDAHGLQVDLMNARVDGVLKGSIDAKYLKIIVRSTDCTRVSMGRGIVLGELIDDPQLGVVLQAIAKASVRTWSKEFMHMQMEIIGKAKCAKNEFGVGECILPDVGPSAK